MTSTAIAAAMPAATARAILRRLRRARALTSGEWPTDPADDVAGGAWAGVVPFHAQVGNPQPAPDLRAGIPVPASVCAMTLRRPQRRGPAGPDRSRSLWHASDAGPR